MKSENILHEAKQYEPMIREFRRHLHRHAETGFELTATKAYVKKQLAGLGYQPIECGRSGLVALAGGSRPGKVFLLRADMDALPIQEESDEEFVCKQGNMHACGHDMHTAMLLGAAKLLKAHEEEIQGTVKLMFQPAEEILEGAHDMLQAGVLDEPKVDAALMLHVMAGMSLPAGTIMVSAPGVGAPAADYFTIRVQGKGCHGSMPNTGVDPLIPAAHILLGLEEINARELAVGEKAALTVGTMQAGSAANVIPDSVEMQGSMRAFENETREAMKERIVQIARMLAEAFRAKAEVRFDSGCPALLNDGALSACAEKYSKELLGPQGALSVAELGPSKVSGSEDFAYISERIPSIMLGVAAGEPAQGYPYPQHHPRVKFDESVLPYGSAVYAYTAMRWLEEH